MTDDDELRRILRGRTPEHGAHFWTELHTGLARVRPGPTPTPPSGLVADDLVADGLVTDGLVTDGVMPNDLVTGGVMTGTSALDETARLGPLPPFGSGPGPAFGPAGVAPVLGRKHPGRARLVLAAAAAVVLAGAATAAALGMGNDGPFSNRNASSASGGQGVPGGYLPGPDAHSRGAGRHGPAAGSPATNGATGSTTGPAQSSATAAAPQTSPATGGGPTAAPDVSQVTPIDLGQAGSLVRQARIAIVGTPLAAYAWSDRKGRDVLLLTREVITSTATTGPTNVIRAYAVAQLGDVVTQVAQVRDEGAGLAPSQVKVVDADHDGVAEIVITLVTGTTDRLAPATISVHRLIHGRDYVLRGTGLPETTVAGLSAAELLLVPTALLVTSLAAVPVAAEWPGNSYAASRSLVSDYLH